MSLFIKLVNEIRTAKRPFIIGIVLLLMSTAVGQFAPLLFKKMIDDYLTPASKWGWYRLKDFSCCYYLI